MNKVKRTIIKIDEKLCDGCGVCVPACPEQALQLVDTPDGPKARLVKEFYCDGLGACLGACPTGALQIEESEVEPYNEEATIARIKDVAPEMLETHLEHMKEHAEAVSKGHGHHVHAGGACPGSKVMQWHGEPGSEGKGARISSALRQWPVQIHLIPAQAPYLKNADLVIVADCVPFAYANFHQDFLTGNAVLVGCPKLDDADAYVEKIAEIIKNALPRSIQIVNMEVPCCFGLIKIVQAALKHAGVEMPIERVTISIKGDIKERN